MSIFGEISEPSTRTAWEDWDDVTLQESFPELHLDEKKSPPSEIDTLLILEGRYLYNCVKAEHILLEHVNSIQEVNLHLYKTKAGNNYVCIIKDYNLVQSGEIVELLKDYIINSTNVITMLTKPLVEYQVAQLVTKDYIIRSLFTSNQKSAALVSNFPHLEQPNIIAGVAAGVFCLREILDKPAVSLICYIEHPEEQKIEELQEILEKFKVIAHVEKVERSSLLNSNLYI